jgi:hypothetical protein
MTIDRFVWIGFRVLFYSLLCLLLVIVIYALSSEQFLVGLIFLIIFFLAVYKWLICIKIPAYSLVVREGTVVFFIPEKTVRNRFDFVSRGQTIVELPHFGLLDRPYKLEIFSPDNEGNMYSCRLVLHLEYIFELTALQRAYDSIVLHKERLSLEVRRLLLKSSTCLKLQPVPLQDTESIQEHLKPIIAELNLGLESVGLKIEEAMCSFTAGQSLVRFVATEQETLEKTIVDTVHIPQVASHHYSGSRPPPPDTLTPPSSGPFSP